LYFKENNFLMTIFLAGATGATGSKLLEQLLARNCTVRAVVRSTEKIPEAIRQNKNLELIQGSLLDLSDEELKQLTTDCSAAVSCLGHNLTWKGIYGKPRRLVTNATRRICQALKTEGTAGKVKFVLMNTAGNRNRDLAEPISLGERVVISMLRLLLPPHPDNEQAADYLRTQIGQQDSKIEWVAVRPDSLIDEDQVEPYELHESPIRSALSNPGKTSRNQVAHFMAELITDNSQWQKWKGKMPVIYKVER